MKQKKSNSASKMSTRQKLPILIVIVALLVISSLIRQSREDAAETAAAGAVPAPLATLAPEAEKTPAPGTESAEETAEPAYEEPSVIVDAEEADTYSDDPEEISYTGGSEITEDGTYSSVEDVSYYLHTYGHLPDNYITKSEAEDEGWVSYEGNLWEVTDGASIGGDRFGNREGLLPKGEKYYECDVNYDGGYRGEERLIYTADGDVYYTNDHYKSFEKLY